MLDLWCIGATHGPFDTIQFNLTVILGSKQANILSPKNRKLYRMMSYSFGDQN